MAVSCMTGISVTVSADDVIEWYVGETIDLNGKWFYFNNDDDDVWMALGGTGSTTLSLKKATDLSEYVTSDINITKMYDGSTERDSTDDRINIYIPQTAGKTIYPIGIKVKEGTGTQNDAYKFELIYPMEYTSGGCTVFYDKVSQTVTVRKNGNGIMTDYADYSSVPWKDNIANVEKINIQEGVTYIGDHAFAGNSCTAINIPSSVTYIGHSAFCGSSSQSCTVNFARPNTSQNLQTKGIPFDTGTLKYTGSGTFVLFDGDTDIEDGTSSSVFSSDNTKTFNWRSAPFDITIPVTEHGSVTASVGGNNVTKAETGKVVTLNVTPDTYYELKSITVTSPREGITELKDLVSVMGDSKFIATPDWAEDFHNYYCKIADGKFAVYSDENVIVVELSAGNVKELSYVGDQILVETNDNYSWYFTISGQAIKTITVFIGDERIFHSVGGSSTGSVAPDVLTLTTVTEGSEYTFTMPKKKVTVTAVFELHAHSFSYTADGATITATCTEDCPLTDHKATLTINAPENLTYDFNSDKPATITGDTDILGTPEITYKKENIVLNGAPKGAGTYTASITVGGATASVEYTIAPKVVTVTDLPVLTKQYDGTTDFNEFIV